MSKDQGTKKADSRSLRRRAEDRLIEEGRERQETAGDLTTGIEMERLVQELKVHEIELEMQNEELKQARNEAEKGRELYLDLYDFAPVGYFTLDNDGIIRQANLAGARLLGEERSRLINHRFRTFVSESDIPAFNAYLVKAFVDKVKVSCAVSLVKKGRPSYHVHIEATASSDGRECRMAVLDATERKIAEDEARRLRENLEHLVVERTAQLAAVAKELEVFTYSACHDLMAPLRAVDGYSRILLKKYGDKLSEDATRMLGVIRKETKDMGALIDDLLSFTRVKRNVMDASEIDMEKLVREVWDEILKANQERKLKIKITKLLPVFGDGILIKQVLFNLISNAVKFTKTRELGVIEINSHAEPGKVLYDLKDNGVGFDMRFSDRLFSVFQRLHGDSEYEGTGIGLALVQRIIHRHGGHVWAEGEVDAGATFHFTLPQKEYSLISEDF